MSEWLIEIQEMPRWGFMLMLGWMIWCQISWLDGRREIKRLKQMKEIYERMIERADSERVRQ